MVKFKNIILLAKACAAGYLAYTFLYDKSFVDVLINQHHYLPRTAQLLDYYGRVALLFVATLWYLPKLYSARIALTLAFFVFAWYSKMSKMVPPPVEYLHYAFYAFSAMVVVDFLVRYAKNDFGVELSEYRPLASIAWQAQVGQQHQPWMQWQQPAYDTYGAPPDSNGGYPHGIVIPDSAMGDIGAPIVGMDDLFGSWGNETPEELELMEEMQKPPEEWKIIAGKKMNPRNMLCSQNYVLTERIFNEIA